MQQKIDKPCPDGTLSSDFWGTMQNYTEKGYWTRSGSGGHFLPIMRLVWEMQLYSSTQITRPRIRSRLTLVTESVL